LVRKRGKTTKSFSVRHARGREKPLSSEAKNDRRESYLSLKQQVIKGPHLHGRRDVGQGIRSLVC